LDALRNGVVLSREHPQFAHLIRDIDRVRGDRHRLREREAQHRGNARALPEELRPLLDDVAEGGEPVGALIEALLAEERAPECVTYWSRILAENASEADDVPGLVAILGTEGAAAGHTAARRA